MNVNNDRSRSIPALVAASELILSRHFAQDVHLTLRDTWMTWKSLVVRCTLAPSASHLPATIIAKRPYALLDDPFAHQVSFINEWAALVFLEQIATDRPLAPRCYGGDSTASALVLEDLGNDDQTTAQVLVFGTNPRRAEVALLEHVALIGRLHATTIGKYGAYAAIRAALNPPVQSDELLANPWPAARRSAPATTELDSLVHAYRAACALLSIRPPMAIGDDISAVAQHVEAHPGPWLALCQGDQNGPGGTLRLAGQLRLYDFDCGQFRHAFLEGVPGRSTWGCVMRIPLAIAHQMETVYRDALAVKHPQIHDERFFRAAITEAHARWHLFQVLHRLPSCLIQDAPRGPTTRRQQFLAWMDSFADITEEATSMQALGTMARTLAGKLRRQWPSDVHILPYYPAFQSEASS
jgi:hypothetical protein